MIKIRQKKKKKKEKRKKKKNKQTNKQKKIKSLFCFLQSNTSVDAHRLQCLQYDMFYLTKKLTICKSHIVIFGNFLSTCCIENSSDMAN